MVRERESEAFQPHMVASFSRRELAIVGVWIAKNVHFPQGDFEKGFKRALETSELDEKGNSLNEEGRRRLEYAKEAIGTLLAKGHDFNFSRIVGQVQVWQMTTNKDGLQIRVNRIEDEDSDSK